MNDTDSIDKKVAYSDLPETLLYKKTYFVVSYSTIEQTIQATILLLFTRSALINSLRILVLLTK